MGTMLSGEKKFKRWWKLASPKKRQRVLDKAAWEKLKPHEVLIEWSVLR